MNDIVWYTACGVGWLGIAFVLLHDAHRRAAGAERSPSPSSSSAPTARFERGLTDHTVEDRLLSPIALYKTARAAEIEGRAAMTTAELLRALTARH